MNTSRQRLEAVTDGNNQKIDTRYTINQRTRQSRTVPQNSYLLPVVEKFDTRYTITIPERIEQSRTASNPLGALRLVLRTKAAATGQTATRQYQLMPLRARHLLRLFLRTTAAITEQTATLWTTDAPQSTTSISSLPRKNDTREHVNHCTRRSSTDNKLICPK